MPYGFVGGPLVIVTLTEIKLQLELMIDSGTLIGNVGFYNGISNSTNTKNSS